MFSLIYMLKTSKLTVLALVLAMVASTVTTIVLMEQQTAFALAKITNNNNPFVHSIIRAPSSATYAHSSGHLTSSISSPQFHARLINPPFQAQSSGGHLALLQDLNPTDG
jgi:hypothetical protein